MKTLNGKATVLFNSQGLSIELKDTLSGVTIRARIKPLDAIDALSSLADVPCQITYPDRLDLIGMQRETKKVMIDVVWETYEPTEKDVTDQCIAEGLLVDGWEISNYGLHRQQPNLRKHGVWLKRYVPIDPATRSAGVGEA